VSEERDKNLDIVTPKGDADASLIGLSESFIKELPKTSDSKDETLMILGLGGILLSLGLTIQKKMD
ncbi:LPXTG cell wall anchor domain-containing protein, partial [Streptococcus sp. DD10]|uniref:LPXTG cell wall anchor domain-containing protein n=1 Tax=Streptococcus sp. DD10 TaxID=1777878 RepID=UPI0018D48A01